MPRLRAMLLAARLRNAIPVVLLMIDPMVAGCEESEDATEPTTITVATGGDVESFSRCPTITSRRVAQHDFAFAGTLDRIEGPDGVDWVFSVDHWYHGGDDALVANAGTVVVHGSDVSIHYFAATVRGPSDPGTRYLVAGHLKPHVDPGRPGILGVVAACFTAEHTERREAAFAAAFGSDKP